MKYIFDSNVYDYLHDKSIATNEIRSIGSIFITNIQLSEVINIPDEQRRRALLATIDRVDPQKLQLLSGVWIDALQWDEEQVWIDDINPACTNLLGNATKNIPWMDALIGEVALHQGLILVTSDQKFAARAASNGIQCVTPNDLFSKNQ
ncbi:type II toxin-antitoxin system VapC family toxin [Ideonella sp.]|jgi:predicted nucleic acid-binding protein|uniref:type II toxin-antitoxin system VapC family toxin n=1 Tax=Ideonella sp. TaxID=1929293 RepID=UPI0037BE6DAE